MLLWRRIGKGAQSGQDAYSVSKRSIVAVTLPIAREFARPGIRMLTIAMGTSDAPLVEGLPEALPGSPGNQAPFPSSVTEPVEFAVLAKHIIENKMLNDEVVRLDRAIRMASE